MPQHATKQKLQSWLTCRMLCCCTYIGLAAEQLANLHRNASSYVFVTSCIVMLIAIATTSAVAIPAFRCQCFLCRCGIAVALVHSRSIALTPDASSPPVVWVAGSVPVRNVFCNLPPQKHTQSCKARSLSCQLLLPCSRWEVARHVESQGKRGTNKSQSQR